MCTGAVFSVSSLVYFLVHCLELNAHISRSPLRVCRLGRLDIVGELQLLHCTCYSDYLSPVFLVCQGSITSCTLNTHLTLTLHAPFLAMTFDSQHKFGIIFLRFQLNTITRII